MGYNLHITRKDCWADEEDERSISIAEWKTHVDNDPEITLDPENPGEKNYLYIRAAGNWPLWFYPKLGNIYTKNPETDVIKKMVRVANLLGASVRGDDGELYDLSGNMVSDQSEKTALPKGTIKKPWWKFW